MKFEENVNDTSYGNEKFTEKYKLMTHLFHSKLERNKSHVNYEDVNSMQKFIKNNAQLLLKIKRSIFREYDYKITNFQVNVACCFFLNKKMIK
jgi:hypothetical protein